MLEGVTPYPYNINMGQDVLTGMAKARLEKLSNAEIRFGAEVAGLAAQAG